LSRSYVKVINVVGVDGPRPISANGSESTNTQWDADQMRRWDYYEVNLDFNEEVERIDYANPVITPTSVTYNRIQLDSGVVLSELKKKLIKTQRGNMINRVFLDYDREDILLVALGAMGGVSLKANITAIVNAWQDYKQAVNNSTTPTEAKACVVNWP